MRYAPPPPIVETQTTVVAPDPAFVWVGGAWIWSGRWVWAPGHWARPPHVGAVWFGPHYVFRGDEVDLRGQTHPPLNAWPLALLVAAFGGVQEIPFHAAYMVFSLIAVWAMWSLARRFSPHPLWATLLFCAVPAFVVNGNSLEPDVPFLAFWMASIALFCSGRLLAFVSGCQYFPVLIVDESVLANRF